MIKPFCSNPTVERNFWKSEDLMKIVAAVIKKCPDLKLYEKCLISFESASA